MKIRSAGPVILPVLTLSAPSPARATPPKMAPFSAQRLGQPVPANATTVLALRSKKTPFTIDAPVIAAGTLEQSQRRGGSSFGLGVEGVRFEPRNDGTVVAHDLCCQYIGGAREDVVLEPDGHGGYAGASAFGEWTLSPEDKRGVRELVLAPPHDHGDRVRYVLGVPRPSRDLAKLHGATIVLSDTRTVTIDASGPALVLAPTQGPSLTLTHQHATGAFADRAEDDLAFRPRALLFYSPLDARYVLELDGAHAEIGPFTAAKPRKTEQLRAFVGDGSVLVTTEKLPHDELLVRFSETAPDVPATLYLRAPNAKGNRKGETRAGGHAKLKPPDANGERLLTITTASKKTITMALVPHDTQAMVQRFAGQTLTVTLPTPSASDPSGPRPLRTHTLAFKKSAQDDRIGVMVDGTPAVLIANTYGDYAVEVIGCGSLLLTPLRDGTFDARFA